MQVDVHVGLGAAALQRREADGGSEAEEGARGEGGSSGGAAKSGTQAGTYLVLPS